MSEERAAYITDAIKLADIPEVENEMHEIRDEAPHNHFTSIPNMVDDMKLSPYAFRLYSHLKRVAGDLGACWQSTNTLAETCCMSMGMVSKSKRELSEKGLIRVERKHKPDGNWYHEIKIIDIWGMNSRAFSPPEGAFSYGENGTSPHESKKNPIKKNQEHTRAKIQIPGIESSIRQGRPTTQKDIDATNAAWSGREKIPEPIRELLDVYVELTCQRPTKGQLIDWLQTGQEWLEMGIVPADLKTAYSKAKPDNGDGFMVARPGSLTRVAGMVAGERRKNTAAVIAPQGKVESVYFDPSKPFYKEKEPA